MEERRNLWNPTQGESNSWADHREMDVEVSQYLETECRHSIVPRDCPFNDVVPCLSFSPQLVYGARDVDSWVKFYLKEDRLTIEIEKSWYVLCLEEEGPFLFSNESLLDITGRIDKKNLNRDSMTLCRDICSIPDSLMDVCRNFRTWTYRTLSQSVSSFWIPTYRRRMIVIYDSFQFGHNTQLNQRNENYSCVHMIQSNIRHENNGLDWIILYYFW